MIISSIIITSTGREPEQTGLRHLRSNTVTLLPVVNKTGKSSNRHKRLFNDPCPEPGRDRVEFAFEFRHSSAYYHFIQA